MKNYKILVVDDEFEIADNYVKHLRRTYTNVISAYNGIEAHQLYLIAKPDIILLDLNLPRLGGLELLKKIRSNDKKTKIVIISAHSDSKVIEEVLTFEVTKYLLKPVTREELSDVLSTIEDELE